MLIRVGFFFSDRTLITKNLVEAEKLIDEGGDWDRRNRLKVYNSLHLLSINHSNAQQGFLDALSTFAATELIS
ncbi:26S proteasome, regulatory subunit Rpn7 [Coprinopsis sp. MPI-PUGE-AT-0042]|nr:26S proteasome, regulatory subunit Rpn7 [Coprinopsis sp. MPI-PUGE-AT-0042]